MKHKQLFKIDKMYYISRLRNPLTQIFESVFGTTVCINNSLDSFSYKTEIVKHVNNMFKPVLPDQEKLRLVNNFKLFRKLKH